MPLPAADLAGSGFVPGTSAHRSLKFLRRRRGATVPGPLRAHCLSPPIYIEPEVAHRKPGVDGHWRRIVHRCRGGPGAGRVPRYRDGCRHQSQTDLGDAIDLKTLTAFTKMDSSGASRLALDIRHLLQKTVNRCSFDSSAAGTWVAPPTSTVRLARIKSSASQLSAVKLAEA